MKKLAVVVFLSIVGIALGADTRTWKPKVSEIESFKALRAEQKVLADRHVDLAQQAKQLEADDAAVAARVKELLAEIGERLTLTASECPRLAMTKDGMFCLVAEVTSK